MIHFYPIKPFSLWLSVIICGLQNIISWWRGLHYLLTCGYVVVTLSFLKSMQQEFTFEHSIIHAARDDCDWLEDKQTSQSCPDPKPPTAKPTSSPNTGRWGSGHARRRWTRNASVNRVGSCGRSCTFDVHSVVGSNPPVLFPYWELWWSCCLSTSSLPLVLKTGRSLQDQNYFLYSVTSCRWCSKKPTSHSWRWGSAVVFGERSQWPVTWHINQGHGEERRNSPQIILPFLYSFS